MLPDIARVTPKIELFASLNEEQIPHLAHVCNIRNFKAGEYIFKQEEVDPSAFILLEGIVNIQTQERHLVGEVKAGECLGEIALLTGRKHTMNAVAKNNVSTAEIPHEALHSLIQRRPDIGTVIYRNLALGLGQKLKRTDESISC